LVQRLDTLRAQGKVAAMLRSLRPLVRRFLAVERTPTYYLPWLTRPGLECVLILNNVESRFKAPAGDPIPISAKQYDSDGTLVRCYDATLADSTDAAEVRVEPTAAGCGIVTVDVSRLKSDLYVTLSDGEAYQVTHGRGEFIETYPCWVRTLVTLVGGALAQAGRTIPAFTRYQYVYRGLDYRSHLLLMNLSNVTNRIRMSARWGGTRSVVRLVTLPPMGTRLVDVRTLVDEAGTIGRLKLEANAWFNLYLVGAGSDDLAGPLSIMHVK
jgi:hypothetical protein